MQKLLNKYAQENIEIRFPLVAAEMGKRKRKRYEAVSTIVFLFFLFFLVPVLFNKIGLNGVVPLVFAVLISTFIFDYITKQWLLQLKQTGVIKFLHDTIEVEMFTPSIKYSFAYDEIKGIRYRKNVLQSIASKSPSGKTFVVEFVRYGTFPVVVEIGREMLLTEKERIQFWSNPEIKKILQLIASKYGTEEVKKIIPELTFQNELHS